MLFRGMCLSASVSFCSHCIASVTLCVIMVLLFLPLCFLFVCFAYLVFSLFLLYPLAFSKFLIFVSGNFQNKTCCVNKF